MGHRSRDGDRARRRHFEIECELANRLRCADKDRRRTLYREVYDELFARVDLPGNEEAQRAQVPLLEQLIEPFLEPGGGVLEIGAGGCDLSLALARRGHRVWAVEAVDPGIDLETAPDGFRFVTADAVEREVPSGEIDVALSCHFVEHLHPDDLEEHLLDVLAKLRPGGAYVVVTPNRLYGPHDVSRGFSPVPLGFHLREYTHLELAAEMRSAGFCDVRPIGKIGERQDRAGWWRVGGAERVLGALPFALRQRLLEHAPRQAPFRPLEQVKLVGFGGSAR